MKKSLIIAIVAMLTLGAMAQSKGVKLRKTTIIDTILVDLPNHAASISDSTLKSELRKTRNELKEIFQERNRIVIQEVKDASEAYNNFGRGGNFFIILLKNTLPIIPFVAIVFIAFFWFRNAYRRRVMRNDMMWKYIERGDEVPEWLVKLESNSMLGGATNEPYNGNRANAKTFLVISIIMCTATFVWLLILVQISSWEGITLSSIISALFAVGTVYCFKQYIRRSA